MRQALLIAAGVLAGLVITVAALAPAKPTNESLEYRLQRVQPQVGMSEAFIRDICTYSYRRYEALHAECGKGLGVTYIIVYDKPIDGHATSVTYK